MKRILQVIPSMELNGITMFNMNHFRSLRDVCCFDFMVFHEADSPLIAEVEAMGGHVYCSGPTELRHIGRFLKRAEAIMREHGPYDAVHSHVNIAGSWVLLAAKRAGVPVRIAHSHGVNGSDGGTPLKRLLRESQRRALRRLATQVQACSAAAGAYLFGEAFFQSNGTVIPNGIDTTRFTSVPEGEGQAVREELSIPKDCPLVVENISRFDADKNPLFSVEVFAEVLKLEPKAVLILGGPDAGLLEETKQRILALGIETSVRLTGRRSDIPACLRAADVFLMPSVFEGLGIALLEAQAAGCFCMVSDRVPREADMGLGSVTFETLETGPETWARTIVEGRRRWNRPETDAVSRAFAEHGYEIASASRMLLETYGVRAEH